MNKDNINIGEKFKDAFQNYEITPEPKVWTNIESSIRPGNSFVGKKISFLKVAIVSFTVLSIVTGIFLLMNNQKESETGNSPQNPISSTKEKSHVTLSDQTHNNLSNKSSKTSDLTSIQNSRLQSNNTQKTAPAQLVIMPKTDEVNNKTENTIDNQIIAKTETNPNGLKNIKSNSSHNNNNNNSNNNITNSNNTEIEIIPEQTTESIDSSTQIAYSANPIICFGEDVILEVNSKSDLKYRWENGSINSKIKVKPLQNSEYNVTVTDNKGIRYDHTFKVTIDRECTAVFVPTAFTPNGDGNNDVFIAQGLGIQEFYMQVVNRAGQIVFESSDINKGWDASNIKENPSSDIYIFIVKYVDAKGNHHLQKGQVTLIR